MGPYGSGKTHLAAAIYAREVACDQPVYWASMAELLAEFRQAEMDSEFYSAARDRARHWSACHFFIDDIDKFKVTDFKFEVLFDFFDTLYRRKLRLTVTSNLSLRQLIEMERLHPAIVRRIDDMCKVVEL
jgi:DNA replication protein DnaC